MTLSLIVAVSKNGFIGKDGSLPWRISEDLKRFRTITSNAVVIMGKNTFLSIGKPLPNRENIVVSTTLKSADGCEIVRSLDEAIKIADAIIVLRLQKERMMENLLSSIDSYSLDYGLTPEKLSLNNKEIPILHPGPINRDIEISSKVVDRYPNCLINNQVANGIPIRMALLYLLQKHNK